ncbi:hypothetical protein ABEB36_012833 [Hypothenemus hampei]|uniref:Uncharacterized protein n=1 Tax=Hypothenemus hampei TaxID=57062 RepID=A0ABD1EAF3_HYPHA
MELELHPTISTQVSLNSKKRKKGVKGKLYASEVIKKRRTEERPYTNSSGKEIWEKKIGVDCKCRLECYTKTTEEQSLKCFTRFYEFSSKNEQDKTCKVDHQCSSTAPSP